MAINEPAAERTLAEQIANLTATAHRIEEEVGRVIVGQTEVVREVLTALLAGGHVLLEGVPGLGKTALVRTLGQVLMLDFARIQFTPDLMPADIAGTNIIVEDGGRREFRFQPGPIFANLLLADEINRATPKTQSALLEAMQEHTATTAGVTRSLPRPFFVLATQNPIEMEGTYPLPEAQLDRFLFKTLVRFPSADELARIATRTTGGAQATVSPVAGADDVIALNDLVRRVPAADAVVQFAVRILLATHPDQANAPAAVKRYVRYGASPRGLQALLLSGKVRALLEGRFNVAFDDVRAVAKPALRHRFFLNFEGEAAGLTTDAVIDDILTGVSSDGQGV